VRCNVIATTILLAAAIVAFCTSPALGKSTQPTVALLPPRVDFEFLKHTDVAEAQIEALQAALADHQGLRWVERARINEVLQEQQRIRALGHQDPLVWGAATGADLLVLPRFICGPSGWSLRLLLMDPEKADVLDEVVRELGGDQTTPPPAAVAGPLADELQKRLHHANARLLNRRTHLPVGVLFFSNVTISSERLNGFGQELMAALQTGEGAGTRVLLFPAVEPARAEQHLALGGITGDEARWKNVAKWWVWGEFEEIGWEGKPFGAATLVVRVSIWDGKHLPLQIEERGTVAERDALATRVGARVADAVSKPPETAPLPPQALAERLLAQATDITSRGVGREWGADAAFVQQWRQACRLLELARFVDPGNRSVSIEWLRTRFREDMTKAVGSSGTENLDEPKLLWLLRRAEAWGEHVEQFGLEGRLPTQWAARPNITDNRTSFPDVARMYLTSAIELLETVPNSDQGRAHSKWPLDRTRIDMLVNHWSQESVRRMLHVAREASTEVRPSADDVVALVEALDDNPQLVRSFIEHILPLLKGDDLPQRDRLEWRLQQTAKALGEPGWAEPVLARLPAPQRPVQSDPAPSAEAAVTPRPAATARVDAQAAIDLSSRYSINVAAIGAWQDNWIIAAGGQDLAIDGMPLGSYLFVRTAKDGDRFRRIEQSLGLPQGVSAIAADGSMMWMATNGNGLAQMDLETERWRRWHIKAGLPVGVFCDIDVAGDGVPVAASGESVFPPVITLRENERWISYKVETYQAVPTNGRVLAKPHASGVAATSAAVVVIGSQHGHGPFISLWKRRDKHWIDIRARLMQHLAEQKFPLAGLRGGADSYAVADAIALPTGGFVLLHKFGATWLTDGGQPLRTQRWASDRTLDDIGRGALSTDGSRIWVPANDSAGQAVVVELPLAVETAPTLVELSSLESPRAVAQSGDRLLIAGNSHRIFSLPLQKSSLLDAGEQRGNE
jgi:hypothetical protein